MSGFYIFALNPGVCSLNAGTVICRVTYSAEADELVRGLYRLWRESTAIPEKWEFQVERVSHFPADRRAIIEWGLRELLSPGSDSDPRGIVLRSSFGHFCLKLLRQLSAKNNPRFLLESKRAATGDLLICVRDSVFHIEALGPQAIPTFGPVVARVPNRTLADAMIEMYYTETDSVVPLVKISPESLTLVERARVERELARACDGFKELDAFSHHCRVTVEDLRSCVKKLTSARKELEPHLKPSRRQRRERTKQREQPPLGKPARAMIDLGLPGDCCYVLGRKKRPLTDAGRAVVAALIDAGANGERKDSLQQVRPSALRILKELRKDRDWARVIIMAGRTNGRYRVRT